MDNDDQAEFKYRPNDTFIDDDQSTPPANGDAGSRSTAAQELPDASGDQIEWTALEFEERTKRFIWYAYLAIAVIVLSAVVYLASREYFAAGLVVAIGLLFGFSASRKPRKLNYVLGRNNISIAGKVRNFDSFKAFWLDLDPETPSFTLQPLKRFVPPLKIYFDNPDTEKISKVLSESLPLSEPRVDIIDKFLQKIHF